MERIFLVLSGVFGFLAVALGAFGAHALRIKLAALADGPARLGWWQTAATYQATHAGMLAVVALLWGHRASPALSVAGSAFALGIVLFSGSLYLMTVTGFRPLGAITPLGGLSLLIGWGALIAHAARSR